MLTGTQTAQKVLPLLTPFAPIEPSTPEFQKRNPFAVTLPLYRETVKPVPYSESDYLWLAGVLTLLIDIGNRDEALSFNIISRSDYRYLSPLLEELIFTVDENEYHPAASLMMLVGFLVERYEKENVPKLSDLPTESGGGGRGDRRSIGRMGRRMGDIGDKRPHPRRDAGTGERTSPGCYLRMD